MEIERTGINEPAIIEDILISEKCSDLQSNSTDPGEHTDWIMNDKPRVFWVVFGDIEISLESGICQNLTSGDRILLHFHEKYKILTGRVGAGYVTAIAGTID